METFLKVNDFIDSIFIVEAGTVEVYTELEGHDFIVDRLYRGSVINRQAIMNIERS